MGLRRRTPPLLLLLSVAALCWTLIHPTEAVVSQTMGNITFECPDGFKINGPDCYLLVNESMTYDDAEKACKAYGTSLVAIRDEVEAKEVGRMVQASASQWDVYWIGNVQQDADTACSGFWDIGEPQDVTVTSPIYVAATAPQGRWRGRPQQTRLPFVCRADACVQGTFRCWDGKKCISNRWKCDGEYDCGDQSDENDCASNCTYYYRQETGTLSQNTGYSEAHSCTWVIEGPPGKPLSIEFSSLNVEEDVDYVEVWSGTRSVLTSQLQARLTGTLTNRRVYGHNNFLIVRLMADLTNQNTGFTAQWEADDELSHREREVTATDSWTELTSPYYNSDPSPSAFVRQYTVTTDQGSLITMEVLENSLGETFEYDSMTLSNVNGEDMFPAVYVSRSNTFTFFLSSDGGNTPAKFRARVRKGCMVDFERANGFIRPPLFEGNYPPSVTCSYVIRAPADTQRTLTLQFASNSLLADAKDYVKLFDGSDNSSAELTPDGGFKGSSAAPNTTFTSTGPVVFALFHSSLVQTAGNFTLDFDLECPAIMDTDNMTLSTTNTQYGTDVTLSCSSGFAFTQEEFVNETQVVVSCDMKGEWSVRRLPTCSEIYCGVPEAIDNGFISEGSGDARYGATVVYQCFAGFTMSGSNTSTCEDGSRWSTRPTCEASNCTDFGSVDNGRVAVATGSNPGYGTVLNITCDPGFDLIGSRYSYCQTDGSWSHPAPVCRRIKCPLPEVDMATFDSTEPVEFEDELTVTCQEGFVINGTTDQSQAYSCQSSGGFAVSRDACSDLDECSNGADPCTGANEKCVNTVGSYTCVCMDKYRRVGNSCQVINRCNEGTSGCDSVNGFCQATNNGEDYVCGCKDGYVLFTEDGQSGRSIPDIEDGRTPGDVLYLNHTCVPVTCGPPPAVTNGQAMTNKTSFDFKDEVEYRCDFGFEMQTTNDSATVLVCSNSISWTPSPPTCEPLTCDPLTATGAVLGINPSGRTSPEDMVVLQCGSQTTGQPYNRTLYCAWDRNSNTFRLQGDSPHCPEIDCGEVGTIGGSNFAEPSNRSLGSSFNFTCGDGFTLEGLSTNNNEIVTCEKNGRWGLGSLTCSGSRCTDPGTPGGMSQTYANFDVTGSVIYDCERDGYTANPMTRTCMYNATEGMTFWDGSEPVCEDVEDPEFTSCPSSPVSARLYSTPSSVFTTPTATDNSGLVKVTVSPVWFSADVALDAGSLNVTYTATDAAGNFAHCSVTVEVHDPGTLPSLTCPEYLTLDVNTTTPYTVHLADYVTADAGVNLTYSGGPSITVGPGTVGTSVYRVTATDGFGFQRQCAFVVDIRPNSCLSTYLETDQVSRNSSVTCSSADGGVLNCTVTCHSGFAFQDGSTAMAYNCEGANSWTPPLPARYCVETEAAKYIYVVDVAYSFSGSLITNCRAGLTTRLEEHVPTQTVRFCSYSDGTGGFPDMKFEVTSVDYRDVSIQTMTARISLSVTSVGVSDSDYTICALRIADPAYYGSLYQVNATSVSCTGFSDPQTLIAGNATRVSNSYSCPAGSVLTQNTQLCVQCEPGYFFDGSVCTECVDGDYQDLAGQTQCKTCGNGATFSTQPRLSADQCVASCPLGFYNGEGPTASPGQCMACPVDTYLDTVYTATCSNCSDGKTTSGVEGATQSQQCTAKCAEGQYPVSNTECEDCPQGYYKDTINNTACTPCGMDETTDGTASTGNPDCATVTQSITCDNGVWSADYHVEICTCNDGYSGETCDSAIDACVSSPCYNNGTCSSLSPATYECACPFEETCTMVSNDVRYDSSYIFIEGLYVLDEDSCKQRCISTTECAVIVYYTNNFCLLYNATQYSNGTADSSSTTFLKSCARTFLFEGDQCEIDAINDCTNETCADITFCRDLINGADCVCPSESKYTQPKCEVDSDVCGTMNCEGGSTCIPGGDVRATCICPPGFTGDRCEQEIDECKLNPDGCLYGGSCNNLINDYSCSCNSYSGDHCQIMPDFCSSAGVCADGICYNDYNISSATCVCDFPYQLGTDGECEEIDVCAEDNPCQNNSTCEREGPGMTRCLCADGFTGSVCQHDIDDCLSQPCVNGRCEDLVNGYMCYCQPGYDGDNCTNNINDCTPDRCNSSGSLRCDDLVDDYMCVCNVGFTGKDCETNINECLSLPCQHNGSCVESSTPGQYNCTCQDGWTGDNCESLPQFCSDGTCNNASPCYSLQDNFFCECVSGTFGDTCETTNNLCNILDPCAFNNTCQVGEGTATCQCPSNYTGSSCNVIQDTCRYSPCDNGGTCVPLSLGYNCQCKEGYSGDTCTVQADLCNSTNCPSGASCVVEEGKATCVCGVGQLQSGSNCKDASNNFDIYFTRRSDAVRSSQPFRLTKGSLTLMLWVAPFEDTPDAPVQLRLSDRTRLLSVDKENVTFGSSDPVRLRHSTGDKEYEMGKWNQVTVTWNNNGSYDIYFNGLNLEAGTTSAAFPPLNELIFIYIGGNFTGYISQVTVWQREVTYTESLTMYSSPRTPSSQDLVAKWSGYRLYDNLWSRLIYPSVVATQVKVCGNGQTGASCDGGEPDKNPPTVTGCQGDVTLPTDRLVQITETRPDNLFGDVAVFTNLQRTVLTFGAHPVVYMASDEENNVAFCRFNAYVQRDGQSCANTEGLDTSILGDCASAGQKVQCTAGTVAPLSPNILTCGKLGSYNLDDPYNLPPAVICGAVTSRTFTVTVTMDYDLAITCTSNAEGEVITALQQKVTDLYGDWPSLCPDNNCNNAVVSAKCEGSGSSTIVTTIQLSGLPETLTHVTNGVELSAKELLQTATLEIDSFVISAVYNAALQTHTVVIVAAPSCEDGYGLAADVCVECTSGSFLNETTGMCQLCAVGSYTDTDRQTQCTPCTAGQTTLQEGSTSCTTMCSAGEYWDISNGQCSACDKNFYQNEPGQVTCLPCPAGKATETGGADSIDLCYDTCDAGTELKNSTCVPCARGYYRDGLDQDQEVCVQCPSGYTTEREGATAVTFCYQPGCQPGQFRNSTSNTCEQCDYGFYQPDKWQDQCLSCNDSYNISSSSQDYYYTTENQGSTMFSQCLVTCPPGKENLAGTSCTPCSVGYYRTASMEDRFRNCTACNDSFTTGGDGSQLSRDCDIRICNAGSYRNESDNTCNLCPEGQYQPDSLQTSCLECPDNQTTRQMGAKNQTQCIFYCTAGYGVLSAENQTCSACARGTYKTNVGEAKFDVCQPCPSSNTTETTASVSAADCNIFVCEAGQFINNETGVCEDCLEDTYQPESLPNSQTKCQKCPNGSGTRLTNRTSENNCEPVCDAGEQFNSAIARCEPCPLGTWNSGNDTQRFEQCAPCRDGYVTVNETTGATSNESCTLRDCPAGTFIDGTDCSPCPVGTYQDLPRQDGCKDCRPNTNTSGNGHDEETDCTISCPAGQEQVVGSDNDCKNCTADFVKATTGPGNCQQCTGNYTSNADWTICNVLYCDSGFRYNSSANTCEACEQGTYKVDRGRNDSCEPCPANTTTVGIASTSPSDCSAANCVEGFFSPTTSLPCLPCAVGTYKDTVGNDNCTDCSVNSTTEGVGSTSSGQCSVVVCPVGQFRDPSNTCQDCAKGSYQDRRGQVNCTDCPAGYTTVAAGSNSSDHCRIVCPAGEFRNDTTNTCEACPVGQYQENSGQTECSSCDPNYTTATTGSDSSTDCYIVCSAGQYNTSRTSCEECPYGQYQPASGSSSCDSCASGNTTLGTGSTSEQDCQPICAAGYSLNVTSRMCVPCPLGFFSPVAGNMTHPVTVCQKCPNGKTTLNTGSDNASLCNIDDCEPGTYRTASVGCEDCPRRQYQPGRSQTQCLSCATGLTTLRTGRISNESCVEECGDGQQYDVVSGNCTACQQGYFRVAADTAQCIKCRDGLTTNTEGQSSCIPSNVDEKPVVQKTFRLTIRLNIEFCNREQVGNTIIIWITAKIQQLNIQYPGLCSGSCVNLRITFTSGCLQGYTRTRRQAGGLQEVEVALSEVDEELQENGTNVYQDVPTILTYGLYDGQDEDSELDRNQITVMGLVGVNSVPECDPGQYISGDTCENCAAGTFSTDGLGGSCTPCPQHTYQDSSGQDNCTSCPDKLYTSSTGSNNAANCTKKCDEPDSRNTYCSRRGACLFDVDATDGVRCQCDDQYTGAMCTERQTATDSKTQMIAGIAGGAGAFLLLLLLITGVVACLRRAAQKGKEASNSSNGHKDQLHLTRMDDGMSEVYPDYNNPLYDFGARGYSSKPAFMYMNPEADQDMRDFYRPDRSTAPPSRPRSRSYESEWNHFEFNM